MSDERTLTGHPMDHGWLPHQPATWHYRFAKLRKPATMQHFAGHSPSGPKFFTIDMNAGDMVKIVMVSRLGDVGITDDLKADNGYGRRVMLEDLYDFSPLPPAPEVTT